MMKPHRDLHRQEVRVRGGLDGRGMEPVALAHAHVAWVEGLPPPCATSVRAMRG